MKSKRALPVLLPFAFAAALSGHSRQGKETNEPVAKEGMEVKVRSCEAFNKFLGVIMIRNVAELASVQAKRPEEEECPAADCILGV